jgi:hypothetical protein
MWVRLLSLQVPHHRVLTSRWVDLRLTPVYADSCAQGSLMSR